jgi:hypothetical protein
MSNQNQSGHGTGGNFSNDPEHAREEGKKGGQQSQGGSRRGEKTGGQPGDMDQHRGGERSQGGQSGESSHRGSSKSALASRSKST